MSAWAPGHVTLRPEKERHQHCLRGLAAACRPRFFCLAGRGRNDIFCCQEGKGACKKPSSWKRVK
jgi:hypothetical protein